MDNSALDYAYTLQGEHATEASRLRSEAQKMRDYAEKLERQAKWQDERAAWAGAFAEAVLAGEYAAASGEGEPTQ